MATKQEYRFADAHTKRERYELRRADLWLEKASFDSHWRDLADFVKPRRLRAYVTDKNRGDRRNQKIIDSTATFAHQTLISGMHTGMTNPSTEWFALGVYDPDLQKFAPVKKWLFDVTKILHSIILKSNAYTSFPTLYGDQSLFGTAAMAILDDEKELFRCNPYPIGTYALGVSKTGQTDTFIREYAMTVGQLVEEFARIPGTKDLDWSKISRSAKNLWDKGSYGQNVEVCWYVTPNPDADPNKLGPEYLPWSSCYFEKGEPGDAFLRESGFHEFPILAPRWSVVAEDSWGTDSPAITALGDIRALQIMTKRKAQAVEKTVNPPLQAPTSVRNQKISLLAGDTSFYDALQKGDGIRPIHEVRFPVEEIRMDINDVRYLIERAFYTDLFRMISSQDPRREKTATEIAELREEKLMALSPVVERNNDECHEPFIDRIYAMADRAGMIPEAPKELQGVSLRVSYISPLSRALKLVRAGGLNQYVQSAMAIFEVAPETRHKTKWLRVLDEYADIFGVDPDMIATDEEALAAIQQEQQAAAEQAKAEQMALMARGTKDLSQTDLGKDNAIARMANA